MDTKQLLSYVDYCNLKNKLAMEELRLKKENLNALLNFLEENLLSETIQKNEFDLVKKELQFLENEFMAMFD